MLNCKDLRDEALRARDRIGEDFYCYFPDWTRDIGIDNLANLPLIYLGGGPGHAGWLYLKHEATYGFNRVAIVVPENRGAVMPGQKAIGIDELLRLVGKLKRQAIEFLCINFSMEQSHYLRYNHIARQTGIKMVDWAEAFRLPVFKELQSGPINDLISGIIEKFDRFLEIESMLEDELSKMTFYSILLYRMTLKRQYLWPISVSLASEYFFSGFFTLGDDEVFIDGGAFDGDTLATFVLATNGRFRHYFGFEPSPENFSQLLRTRDDLRLTNAALEQKAVWSHTGEVTFANQWGLGSRIVAEDDVGVIRTPSRPHRRRLPRLLIRRRWRRPVTAVPAVSLDDYFQNGFQNAAPVTFMKLDVEGAETQALQGARELLLNHKPKLAISAYHLPTDLYDICRFIAELDVGYKVGIRHHNTSHWDTVVYASAD